jgi:hypothetical protein
MTCRWGGFIHRADGAPTATISRASCEVVVWSYVSGL